MYGYIYKTTNLVNGKIYIGKKVSSKFVKDYKGSGKLIRLAFSKYGYINFICEMLEECHNNKELNEREKYYIKLYNSQDKSIGYNISYGGDGGNIFSVLSKEQQEKITYNTSRKLKGRIWVTNDKESHVIDRKNLPYFLKKGFRLGFSNKAILNMKHKHNIDYSKGNKGWFKKGQKSWNKGIPCSEITKDKLSKKLKGHKRLERSNFKASRTMKLLYKSGYINPMKGKIAWNKGKTFIWVTNDLKSYQIPPEQLNDYLKQGYRRGRIYKRFN